MSEYSYYGVSSVRSHIAQGVDPVSLICIFPSLPSTRFFGSSLASGSVGTPKLSENGPEHSQDG